MVITSAHQTFKWSNDAPGQAAVHCVIVQFEPQSVMRQRRLFTYHTLNSQPVEQIVGSINAYLHDGPDVIVSRSKKPLSGNVPEMDRGNMPIDGGHLIFHTKDEYDQFVLAEPAVLPYIRPLLDAQDFLNGGTRWTLWLQDAEPSDLSKMPKVRERLQLVREMRLASSNKQTREWADRPALYVQNRQPESGNYLVIPSTSSERREYVPIGYLTSETIPNNLLYIVPGADLLHFGVTQSRLHMTWMRAVSGKLKSDYRYSSNLVYNTFPWPDRATLTPRQVQAVEGAAQQVLDARIKHQGSTLAQMYDPNLMPADLRAAHNALDRTVEGLYGLKSGSTEAQRLTLLLTKYQELAPTLESQTATPAKKARKKASA